MRLPVGALTWMIWLSGSSLPKAVTAEAGSGIRKGAAPVPVLELNSPFFCK
jgi:hypothetical protein